MPRHYPVLCAMGESCRTIEFGGPRRTDRAWVCGRCADRTASGFRSIADAWEDLEAALMSSSVGGGERGRQRHGAIVRTLPFNEKAGLARRQAAAHVWFTARVVCECRRSVRLPSEVDIPSIANWITNWHIPDLITRPGLYTTTTIVEDTAAIAGRVRSSAYPSPLIRRQATGVGCDAESCGGMYLATVGAGIATDLVCDLDPAHVVPPSVWQRHAWVRAHRPIDLTRLAKWQGLDSEVAT